MLPLIPIYTQKTKNLLINAPYFIVWHVATCLIDIYDSRWT